MPDVLGWLFKPPAMPQVHLEWWARLDTGARMMIKDAYELSFWAGVGQVIPYVLIAGVVGYLIGHHVGQNGRLARVLSRLSERRP